MNNERDPLNIEYSSEGRVVGIYGRRISDYWDHQRDQIVRLSVACAGLGPDCVPALQRSVPQLAAALSKNHLAMSAWIMAEDVYRTANKPTPWSEEIGTYLDASAASLLAVVAENGLVVQYVIDNVPGAVPAAQVKQFPYNQYGGSCAGYPPWFRSAGFAYVSPQEEAAGLMTAKGIDLRTFAKRWADFAEEGRALALEAVKKVQAAKQHFVYYDADWAPPSHAARSEFGAAHVIGVFRTQAPILGSTCDLFMPPGWSPDA